MKFSAYLMENFDHNHQKIHWRLTIIFSLSILLIIFIYSGLILASHKVGKRKFQENVNLQLPPPPQFPTQTNIVINESFRQYEKRTQDDLFIFNFVIWSAGSVIGYFLTGYLLLPAQKKSREQLEFIGNASHELKTPITTIKTELKVIKTEKTGKHLQSSLAIIKNETDNLQNLVNNLLAFNSAETQSHSIEFNLENLVKDKARKYQRIYQTKELQFNLNCPIDYQLTSDPQKVEQILDLLLDNAGKYSTAKTSIKIVIEKKKTRTQIQIINLGIGIPLKDQEKIFNRFYRLTDSQVQKEAGSGLGLAIAKKLSQEIGAQLVLLDGSPTNTIFSLLI